MISVALPTYNNANIIWLALEGLCRQKTSVDWELVVAEEMSYNYFGNEPLQAYRSRLKEAGCVAVRFLSLDRHIPLSLKWLLIYDHLHQDSIGMLLHASDNFAFPERVQRSFDTLSEGADWTHWSNGYFYNVLDGTAALFTAPTDTGLFMAASRKAMDRVRRNVSFRNLPKRGVDSWLRKLIGECPHVIHDDLTTGIHTDGYNTISLGRRELYGRPPFEATNAQAVFNLFPKDVQKKIITLKTK
jgi:hypothetical protein